LNRRFEKLRDHLRDAHQNRELETRDRLLEVGLQLFAEHGFRKVTVRDISQRARANLAAVSYHFGDKLSLYTEIIESAIAVMRKVNDSSMTAAADASPEEKLRQYIHVYLPRIANPHGKSAWLQRLLQHELYEPTPALQRVIEHGILPRIRYLSEVIAEMLDCPIDDARVRTCVMSVQGQCLFYMRDHLDRDFFGWRLPSSPGELDRTAQYVAEFSIAGVRALKQAKRKP
jgi:AcrR family transcriptional regulator